MIMKLFRLVKLLLSLTVLTLSLNSCEWDGSDDENYVELKRPAESIPLSIDLAGVNPQEVILISNGTYLNYTLHSGSHPLVQQKYYLDGVELSEWGWNDKGSCVLINGQRVDDKIHELKLVMALRTNTGSLAEVAGVESYIGEFTFKLKLYQRNENSQLNMRQTLDEGKYLKIEWDKPTEFEVERYEVYEGSWWVNDSPIAIINDPNKTYMVDKNYYYGYKIYRVKAIPRNSINVPDIASELNVDYKIFNQDNITAKISDSKITLEWKNPNPYPVKFVVHLSSGDIVKEVGAGINKIDIPRPHFPFTTQYTVNAIHILPLDADFKDYASYPYADFAVSDKKVSEYPYWMNIVDPNTRSIVSLKNDEFTMHDLFNGLAIKKTGNLPDNIRGEYYFWGDKYSCSKNGKVAIEGVEYGGGNIHVFKDYDFTKKLYTFESILPSKFCISDTHLFYIKQYEKNLYAINMETKEVEDQKVFKEANSYEMQLEISSDGKYLILYSQAVTDSWYTIYEFKENKLQEVRHVRDKVRLALFNPQNASQLIVHDYDNHFNIIDVVSGNIVKTVENNRYLYTDPYTQNILCYTFYKDSSNESFSIYDKTLTKLLYRVKASIYFPKKGEFILANNILYCGQMGQGNYYMDISEAIKANNK